jgi:hypothetical protein
MEREAFIKEYNPLKSLKFGIKYYELCESSSGCHWSFIAYTERDTRFQSRLISEENSKTAAVLLSLVEPLLGNGTHCGWTTSTVHQHWL